MRKMLSGIIAAPISGSRIPIASKKPIRPRRAISTTAPGSSPRSISAPKAADNLARRGPDRPSSSGRAAGRPELTKLIGGSVLSQTIEEGQQGVIHFARPFLLNPMAGAVDQMQPAQAPQRIAQPSER